MCIGMTLQVRWDDLLGHLDWEAICPVVRKPRACEEACVEKNHTLQVCPQPSPQTLASTQLATMSHERAALDAS